MSASPQRGLQILRETMSEWREVRLGDVLESANERLGIAALELPVLSVTKYQGFVPADKYFGKRIASKDLSSYKVVVPGAWVFSTIHIDEGSIARNTLGYAGVVSPMYTTLTWVGRHDDPAFFELLLKSPPMLILYRDHAQGSVNRRRSLPLKTFAALSVQVPPLASQRRIVDLIGALDAQSVAIAVEVAQVQGLLRCVLDGFWAASQAWKTVGEIADIASGPSWAASAESPVPTASGTSVVKITNTRPDGRLDLTERLYVVGLPASTRVLDASSLIVIRTNGNRERIGNVYLPNDAVMGSAVSAFQFIVQCGSSEARDYLYWLLRAPTCQRTMSAAASGSTGLGNLGARWLRALQVPWWDDTVRADFASQAAALVRVLEALIAEGESLRDFRTTVLASLLSGKVEIPESYDALLKAV